MLRALWICRRFNAELHEVANFGPVKTPRFELPMLPIDPRNPFPPGTETEEFTQLYVGRGLVDVPCVAEVDTSGDEAVLGACFDLEGNEIILTEEESEKALREWFTYGQEQA